MKNPVETEPHFLSRRNLYEGGSCHAEALAKVDVLCRITEDVRKYAAERGVSEETALEVGLQDKAKEFVQIGWEIYAKP